MTTNEFILGLVEELELESAVEISTNLKDLEEWDSMAAMLLIGYVSNEFGITLNAEDLKDITTVASLIEKIGANKFE